MRYLILLLLLSACVPNPTKEERIQAAINQASPTCEALGYNRNSEPWRQCVMQFLSRPQPRRLLR